MIIREEDHIILAGYIIIPEDKNTNGLFIELYSDINVFQPGYSELLLDKKYHGYAGIKDYSFAKYINGELVLSTGDFPYDKTDAEYVDKIADYRIFNTEGFRHVLYKNGNATIMITRPELTSGRYNNLFCLYFCLCSLLFKSIYTYDKKAGCQTAEYV